MAVSLTAIFIVVIIVIVVYLIVRNLVSRRGKKKKLIQNVILALLRTKKEASLDDIVIATHASLDEINDALMELIAHGVIKPVNKNGETYYTL